MTSFMDDPVPCNLQEYHQCCKEGIFPFSSHSDHEVPRMWSSTCCNHQVVVCWAWDKSEFQAPSSCHQVWRCSRLAGSVWACTWFKIMTFEILTLENSVVDPQIPKSVSKHLATWLPLSSGNGYKAISYNIIVSLHIAIQ